MGGCRCTYRTCAVKSKTHSKTHMFHYPVFDKVRCHQWLVNAQRLEFLNLKLSQVRNRVVCEHHFKDDCFMNFKKDKLTFEAVPTEDGPYCDNSNKNNNVNNTDTYSFVVSNPDNELTYIDKKANFSKKYADFLTNVANFDVHTGISEYDACFMVPPKVHAKEERVTETQIKSFQDLIRMDALDAKCPVLEVPPYYENLQNPNNNVPSHQGPVIVDAANVLNYNVSNTAITDSNTISTLKSINNETFHVQPVFIVQPQTIYGYGNDSKYQPETTFNFNTLSFTNVMQNQTQSHNNEIQLQDIQEEQKPKEPKVKILSEKTLSDPVPLTGKLEPVSPSLILRVPNRKKDCKQTGSNTVQTIKNEEVPNFDNIPLMKETCLQQPVEIEIIKNTNITEPLIVEDLKDTNNYNRPEIEHNNTDYNSTKSKNNNVTNENRPSISFLKNKMAPERIAAIEKKRNFNKKLRDIIESCLEKSDNQEILPKSANILKVKDTENVSSFLSKDPSLPSAQEYNIAYLEARLKRMESVLSKKIEQNSQRIVEIRDSIMSTPKRNISVSTQTSVNEEIYKKHLFHEISKFLSPSTNSLIYEELFIDKYVQKVTVSDKPPSPKKRKRR